MKTVFYIVVSTRYYIAIRVSLGRSNNTALRNNTPGCRPNIMFESILMQILMMIMSRCCDADEDNKIYSINLHIQQTILLSSIIVVLAFYYALRERFIYLTESTTQITVCSCIFTVEIVNNKELSLSTSEYVCDHCRNLVSCNKMTFIRALRNKIDYLVEEDVVNIEDDESTFSV